MKQGCEIKKLGEITEQINGLWVGKNPPFITIAVIRNTNFTKDCNLDTNNIAYIQVEQKQYSTRKLKCGDIIIEKSGGSDKQPVGRPILFNIEDGEYSFSNFTSVLRVVDNTLISPKFLHKFLVYAYNQGYTLNMQSKTTGIRNLNFKLYKNMNVPVPERAEQERIVGELDCLSGIIAAKRAQLRELDTLAQSIFYTMFGDPITNDKGWQTKKLGAICIHKQHIQRANKIFLSTSKIRYIDISSIDNATNNIELADEIIFSDAPSRAQQKVEFGDILISLVRPNLKNIAVLNYSYDNLVASSGFCILRTDHYVVDKYYLLYVILDNTFTKYLMERTSGANYPAVREDDIKQCEISVPPIDLQQQFAEKIENIERQKELITKSIKETEDLFNSRMDYYFN